MNEGRERRPRTWDDSRVRTLTMATKARRALKLPAGAIDWSKLFATVEASYAQGRTEGEIDWEKVVDCSRITHIPSVALWEQGGARAASGEVPPPPPADWLANLWRLFAAKWAYGFLAAVVVLGLVVFAWTRYREFDRQLEALRQQNESLKQENAALRGQVEKAIASHEQTRQLLTTQQTTFEQKVAQLQNENEILKKLIAQRAQPRVLVAIQDAQGLWTVDSSGTVRLAGKATLPSSISQSVFDLVTMGEVAPTQPVRVAMATLRGDATRGALRSAQSAEKPAPVPKSPVLTAIRSTQPTLQWEAVPGAQEYQVIVAYPEEKDSGKVVWEGSAGTQTQVTLPSGVLQRGQVYLWQVEALVEGQSRLSPSVGFWVIDENTLHEVEAVERKTSTSALVLASVYEAHGLHEDALWQLERLTEMNPTNPFAQAMLYNLRRQLGRE